MYYPASDTIAVKWPKWQTAIAQIDRLLHDNAGKIVRVDFITAFVEESPRTVELLLKEYAERDVIELIQIQCCPNHPGVLLDPQQKNSTLYCDLCDQSFEQRSLLPLDVLRIKMIDNANQKVRPRVFISHSSIDKPFVRKLVKDLESANLPVWFDEQQIAVGDSIVGKINDGLSNSLYIVAVLSKASVASGWVQNELNYATMQAATNKSVVILPALLDDCTIPPLLLDRLYADFRKHYATGLSDLLAVLEQEKITVKSVEAKVGYLPKTETVNSTCVEALTSLRLAELQKILDGFSRAEIASVWFGVLESDMDDDVPRSEKIECILKLLDRARKQEKMPLLVAELCYRRPNLAS